jgi:TRAP-type transport system periplasmic protein
MRSGYPSLGLFCLLTLFCLFLPGVSIPQAQTTPTPTVVKIATMMPRTGEAARAMQEFLKKLDQRTGSHVTARIYWSGVAGDDEIVLRKMRAGQIDSTYLGLEIIRNFVPQAMVLGAPQTYTTYEQVDAVRKALTPEFNETAYRNGFVILNWIDAGMVRIFSQKPIKRLQDFKQMRPWVYDRSPLLKEFYRMIGCAGVPVKLIDVYSALQIGLIDVIWGSAFTTTLMNWHGKMKYVSEPTGLIQGATVVTRQFWDAIGERNQKITIETFEEERKKIQDEMRRADDAMYKRLLKRGITPVRFENVNEWLAAGKELRTKMVGRLYSREMLTRVENIIAKYPDRGGTPNNFR